jgi:hypothetical protein
MQYMYIAMWDYTGLPTWLASGLYLNASDGEGRENAQYQHRHRKCGLLCLDITHT